MLRSSHFLLKKILCAFIPISRKFRSKPTIYFLWKNSLAEIQPSCPTLFYKGSCLPDYLKLCILHARRFCAKVPAGPTVSHPLRPFKRRMPTATSYMAMHTVHSALSSTNINSPFSLRLCHSCHFNIFSGHKHSLDCLGIRSSAAQVVLCFVIVYMLDSDLSCLIADSSLT